MKKIVVATLMCIIMLSSGLCVNAQGSNQDWKDAYYEYIMNTYDANYVDGYALIYLDADDIPELVQVGLCEADGCTILNYYNGEIYATTLGRLYFNYIEKGNQLCNSDGNMGYYYDNVYSIINGEMVCTFQGSQEMIEGTMDDYGNAQYTYAFNGTPVSENTYYDLYNQAYDGTKAIDGYDWSNLYNYEDILNILAN